MQLGEPCLQLHVTASQAEFGSMIAITDAIIQADDTLADNARYLARV